MEFIPKAVKDVIGFIRSAIYSFPVRGLMFRYNVPEQELFQEGLIALWQDSKKIREKECVKNAQDPEGYLIACLKNSCRSAMANYIEIFYARHRDVAVSQLFSEDEEGYKEERLFATESISNEKAEMFARISHDLAAFLKLVVHPKDHSKVDGWMRVLELMAQGCHGPEIERLVGGNWESFGKTKKVILKLLREKGREVFPSIDFEKLFLTQSSVSRQGAEKKLFGAITVVRQEVQQKEKRQKRIVMDFSQMTIKEICEKFGVVKTTAYRAQKQGFLVAGKSQHHQKIEVLEAEETSVVEVTSSFMPKHNLKFWGSIRLGMKDEEWVEMWQWAHFQKLELRVELLEKARRLIKTEK